MATDANITYHRAARFREEQEAEIAFSKIRQMIQFPECELSVYRFSTCGDSYVTVVGDTPEEELSEQLERQLRSGERVELSIYTLDFLRSGGLRFGAPPTIEL